MRTALLLALLFLSPAAGAAEKSNRTCRILFLNAPDDAPEKLHLFDGLSSQEVELTRMGFSPVYQIRAGDITLALLPKAPEPPAQAGSPPVIPPEAPKAVIPAATTDFYLLVSSDPSNKIAPVKLQVINANVGNFPRGHMLWYNLTDSKVGGIIGSGKLLIAPNSSTMLPPPAAKMEDYHVNIQFIPPGKDSPEPLCETNWTHDPRSRGVFFILKPSGSLIPRILGFPDFREAAEEKPGRQ